MVFIFLYLHYWFSCSQITSGFLTQSASYVGGFSMSCHHHANLVGSKTAKLANSPHRGLILQTGPSWDLTLHGWEETKPSLVQIMVCCIFSTKPLSEPMLTLSSGVQLIIQLMIYISIELSIKPLAKNYNEILIEIHTISLTKLYLKMVSAKWLPFCLSLNVFHPKPMTFTCPKL